MARPLSLEDLEHVLEHTRGLWNDLRHRQLFITGGTGFFGCWLLETFAFANTHLGLGANALVLTRDRKSFQAKAPHLASCSAIQLVEGDVRNFTFPKSECSYIIHAAATASRFIEPIETLDTIVNGTRRTLDFAVATGAKAFLLTSSGAVYGRQPADLTHLPETYAGSPDITDPAAAYGEAKRVAELFCATYHRQYGINTRIGRCFAFVGPHLPLDAHFAVGNFIRDALAGEPIRITGDGSPLRSYLYAADLMIWLWTILFKGAPGRAYNVGSDESISILDLAKRVLIACETESQIIVTKRPAPNALPLRYVPDTSRARTELGLDQKIDLASAIIRTAQWLKSNAT
jgi:dTDP-glucose 4,6-dehydratase